MTLFKAMIKIDPSLGGIEPTPSTQSGANQAPVFNSDYDNMRIVQEKKQMYLQQSAFFMQRLIDFMSRQLTS